MYIIGIVGRVYENKDGQRIIQTHDAVRRFLTSRDDVVCVTILPTEDMDYMDIEPGGDKVNGKKLDYFLDKCDAFVVPGGTYGYQLDEYVIHYAIKNDKPLLAICLGFQILCSMFHPGRIKFDMTERDDGHHPYGNGSDYSHSVTINEDTLLYDIIQKDKIMVNSVHHDVVKFDMDTLVVSAIADDGIVEGVEYPGRKFIVGLQWHPEYLRDYYSEMILNRFVDAIK